MPFFLKLSLQGNLFKWIAYKVKILLPTLSAKKGAPLGLNTKRWRLNVNDLSPPQGSLRKLSARRAKKGKTRRGKCEKSFPSCLPSTIRTIFAYRSSEVNPTASKQFNYVVNEFSVKFVRNSSPFQ